jgi:uncharacterized protein YbbC (DUF1343 family)
VTRVATGLELVLDGTSAALRGKRVGLIANATTVDARLRHAVDLLHADAGVDLRVLFGPEHGLRGDAQDMIGVDGGERDARTGLPVYSLYGHDAASLSPTPAMLEGLDAVVFDIQDVGARYYTFVWTMVLAMRACARAGVAVVVLDRPNPIGGMDDAVEGGAVHPGFESFVGLCSVPNRHGMTAGEIARMAVDVEQLDLALEVVAMRGWRRAMHFDDTGLPWVLPSPNMPTPDTALVYPGMCLLEGTELNEGRGTTRPFELWGAPWIDGYALAEALEGDAAALPGVRFRPSVITPTFHKFAGRACGGVQLHVVDRAAFRPYVTGVAILRAVRALWPGDFAWRRRAYEFVDRVPAIDLLCGSAAVREGIDAGASLADLAATWRDEQRAFVARRRAWLLYD